MTPISDFFDIDLIEEQHKWDISQIAYFYQTTEDDVLKALSRANDRLRDNPLSINYTDPDSDSDGCFGDETSTPPFGDVQCCPGESGAQDCEGVVAGSRAP